VIQPTKTAMPGRGILASAVLVALALVALVVLRPKTERTTQMATTTTIREALLPALDAGAPAHTETATFALG
jgi:hypothetical protein